MGPLPAIDFAPEDWPAADADGATTLDIGTAAKFLGLLTTVINYLETEHAKCAEAGNR